MRLQSLAGTLILAGFSLSTGAGCHRPPQVTIPTATYPVPPKDSLATGGGGGEPRKKGEKAKSKDEKSADEKERPAKDEQPSAEKKSDSPKDAQPPKGEPPPDDKKAAPKTN